MRRRPRRSEACRIPPAARRRSRDDSRQPELSRGLRSRRRRARAGVRLRAQRGEHSRERSISSRLESDGYSIVDVKTSECDEDVAAKKAEQYAPQRAAYSQSRRGDQRFARCIVRVPVRGSGCARGRAASGRRSRTTDERVLSDLLQLVRGGSRELTRFPAECGFCGYKEAGWCAGASETAVVTSPQL